MTCTRCGNGFICTRETTFSFRFLIWRCDFSDALFGGPYWAISIPYFSFKDFWYSVRVWKDPWDWKFYTGMTEILCFPGEKSPLWWVFDYHYNKWRDRITLEVATEVFNKSQEKDSE